MSTTRPTESTPGASTADRLRALIEAGYALASELSLDDLLGRLVEVCREITGATYAALGVLDPTGTTLERFITSGIDEVTRARIGALPKGRGILGALITDARPLRLHDIAQDPRSVGFPAGHPPMRSFLGVPIVLRGVVFGNIYLTEKAGGVDFSDEDEELAVLLAGQAAVAVDNARLYEARARWMSHLEELVALSENTTARVGTEGVLAEVSEATLRLIDSETAAILLIEGDHLVLGAVSGVAAEHLRRTAPVTLVDSKPGRVIARGRAEIVDSAATDPEIDQRMARALGIRSAIFVPLFADGEPLGELIIMNRRSPDGRFTAADLRLSEMIGQRAAHAISLSQRVSRDMVSRALAVQEAERRRLGQELHDQAAQTLALILMGIRDIAGCEDADQRQASADRLAAITQDALGEVRALSHQLRPAALERHGLTPALEALAESYSRPGGLVVRVESMLPERLPEEVEVALFRLAQEAIANAVRHADAKHVSVLVTREQGSVSLLIEDDGIGFDPEDVPAGALGLAGMRERVDLLRGEWTLESSPGRGTTLRARIPLARRRAFGVAPGR